MKKLYLLAVIFLILSAKALPAQNTKEYDRLNAKLQCPYHGDSNLCKIVLPYAKTVETKRDTLIGDSLVSTTQLTTSYKIMFVKVSGQKFVSWAGSYMIIDLVLNPGKIIRHSNGPEAGEIKRSGFLNLVKNKPYAFTAYFATYSERDKTIFSTFKDYSYEEVRFDYWLLIGAFFLCSLFGSLLCAILERSWPDTISYLAILVVFLAFTLRSPGISPIYLAALIGGVIEGLISHYRSNKRKNKALAENLNVVSEGDKQSLK